MLLMKVVALAMKVSICVKLKAQCSHGQLCSMNQNMAHPSCCSTTETCKRRIKFGNYQAKCCRNVATEADDAMKSVSHGA